MSEDTKLILSKLDALQEDVTGLKEDVRVLKGDIAGLKEDVRVLKMEVAELKEDMAVAKKDIAGLKEDMVVVKEDIRVLKDEVVALKVDNEILRKNSAKMMEKMEKIDLSQRHIELMVENEIRSSIAIVAENHLDLHRKLNEAMAVEAEKVSFLVKFNGMETSIRNLNNEVFGNDKGLRSYG